MSRRKVATPQNGWTAVTASVRGSSHDRTGLPNQDAVEVRTPAGAAGWLVAAVADGHGGQRYVRSGVGSQLAVATACDVIEELLGADGTGSVRTRLQRSLFDRAAPLIVEGWLARVAAHLAANPFVAEEHVTAAADLDDDPPIAYGSTLILGVLTPTDIGLLQIGDGDALVVASDGSVVDPVPGDDRLVGGETTSLCLPTAVADARSVVVATTGTELLVLSSDGYGNSFASEQWRSDAGAGFLEAVRRDGLEVVGTKLEGWLADSALAGGDDVTMVVAHLGAAGVPAAAPPVTKATSSPRRKRGKALPALLLAAVVGLAVGGVIGWIVKDDGGSSEQGTTTETVPEGSIGEGSTTTEVPGQAPSQGTGQAALESIVVPGRIVTFNAVTEPGEVLPRITLESGGLERQEDPSTYQATVTLQGDVLLRSTQKTITVDGDAAGVRVIGETVWVADGTGRVRAYDVSGAEVVTWQPLQGSTS